MPTTPTARPTQPTPRERLAQAYLYLCTDARRERGDLLNFVGAALAGGVDIVQLRDKGSVGEQRFGPLNPADQRELLGRLRKLTSSSGALLAVNDDPQLAADVQADVLHVGQGDAPARHVRTIVGPQVVIGQSTHTIEQAQSANENPEVDYFCTGPIWETPTKPGRPGTGVQFISDTAALAPAKPWFVIGGIDSARLSKVVAAGAQRIVVVRALTQAPDPAAAAHELKDLVRAGRAV